MKHLAFWCWVAILGTLLIRFSLCYVVLEFFTYLFPDVYQNTALKSTMVTLCALGAGRIWGDAVGR